MALLRVIKWFLLCKLLNQHKYITGQGEGYILPTRVCGRCLTALGTAPQEYFVGGKWRILNASEFKEQWERRYLGGN
jgi:hypothetical protein